MSGNRKLCVLQVQTKEILSMQDLSTIKDLVEKAIKEDKALFITDNIKIKRKLLTIPKGHEVFVTTAGVVKTRKINVKRTKKQDIKGI